MAGGSLAVCAPTQVTAVFVPLALRFANVGGDLSRVAVYFYFTLAFDTVDDGRHHALSPRTMVGSRVKSIMAVFLVALTVFYNADDTVATLCAMVTAGTAVVLGVALVHPEYHGDAANLLHAALGGFVTAANVLSQRLS